MPTRVDSDFKQRVFTLVASIPYGRVMTYGQIAALCGAPWAAWEVGQVAHFGPTELPWQRVVNKHGGLASGYTNGGIAAHRKALEAEKVNIEEDHIVNLADYLWQP